MKKTIKKIPDHQKIKSMYVSDLWADTRTDSVSLGGRLDDLEHQVFEIKKIIKQHKKITFGGYNGSS